MHHFDYCFNYSSDTNPLSSFPPSHRRRARCPSSQILTTTILRLSSIFVIN